MYLRRVLPLVVALLLVFPAAAAAAGAHTPLVIAGIPGLSTLAGLAGSVFHAIGSAVLGAFSWTIGLASKFLLTTVAAIVRMLIPHSWVHKGLQIMQWIVAVPNYAGQVAAPGGGHTYGFAGINALRDLFMWFGIALAPLSLVYATSRAMIGEGDPVAIPVLRIIATGAVIVAYPYWWGQIAALTDQVTNAILTVPQVSDGLYKLMSYAVDGVALGGWQLIDLGLMGAIGLELLGLIFLKIVLILLGALMYATGPVMIGLVPTRAGSALARAWASAVVTLFGVGLAWATVFAVGALLINDSSTAGPLIGGQSAFGSLAGGLLLAVAGVATLWICLKVTKEAGALLRVQISGALVISRAHRSGSSPQADAGGAAGRSRTSASSLREYGQRVGKAAAALNAELALTGPAGARAASGLGAAGRLGRAGLAGTAATAMTGAARRATPGVERTLRRTPAGTVAVRMAHAGTASWKSTRPASASDPPSGGRGARTGKPARPSSAQPPKRRHGVRDATPAAREPTPGGSASTAARDNSASTQNPQPSRPTRTDRSASSPSPQTAARDRGASIPAPAPRTSDRKARGHRSPPPEPRDTRPSQTTNGGDRDGRRSVPKPSPPTAASRPKRSWRRPRADREDRT
jgi:hypothetical protein